MAMGQRNKWGRNIFLSAMLLGLCASLLTSFIFRVVLNVHGEVVVLTSLLVMVIVMILTAKIGRRVAIRSAAKMN